MQYVTSAFNKSGISQQLDSMRATQSLSQIIATDKRNWSVPYNEIAQLKLSNWTKSLKIKKKNGEKRSYNIGRGENWDKLKKLIATKGY
jgi:hypothetical protein